jgi:hypothetical protein
VRQLAGSRAKRAGSMAFSFRNIGHSVDDEQRPLSLVRPRLKKAGLGWVDFQVMRRTHSSLMRELGVDRKRRLQTVLTNDWSNE